MGDIENIENTDEPTTDAQTVEPQGETKAEIDWKAEARKWENRAKASKADSEDAVKWREYEAAQKPIQERLAEELAQARAEASEASAALLRYEIATQKGIPGEATKLLKGQTLEELESEADLLLTLIASQSKPKTPMPDENTGKPALSSLGQITDREQLKSMTPDEIIKARAEGRLDSLMGK